MTESGRGGLSYVVRRGDLRHRTKCGVRRFATTGFDDELLAAVDAAAAAAVPLALVVPLPPRISLSCSARPRSSPRSLGAGRST